MLKVVCGGEEDPTTVIWKEVIAVGQFWTFMKNLWFWFFKKN
jgi:phosphatidylglycerophosphatase A